MGDIVEAREVLAQLLHDRPHHLVVAIEVSPGVGFDLPDYRRVHAWKGVYLDAMRDMPGWRPAWEAAYPELGLRLVAYERGA